MDLNTVLPYITVASIALNAWYKWAAYRRKEIAALVRETMRAYKDPEKTEEDLWAVMDKLDAVMDKK